MDKNELYKEVKQAVDAIFNEKEEAEKQKKAEEALRKSATTIDELTKELESNKSEYSELESKYNEIQNTLEEKEKELSNIKEEKTQLEQSAEEKETELSSIKEEHEKIKSEKEANDKELSSVKEELDNLKKDQLVEARVSELEEAKVASKDIETQKKKIRDMSDEEFASYKNELVSLRETIVASLDSGGDTSDSKKKSFANVDGNNTSFNLESPADPNTEDEYSKLGEAMASLMATSDEE